MKTPIVPLLCGFCASGWFCAARAQAPEVPAPVTIPRVEIAPVAPVAPGVKPGQVAPVAGVAVGKAGQTAPVAGIAVGKAGQTAPVASVAVGKAGKTAPVAGVALANGTRPEVATIGVDAQAIKLPALIAKLRARAITPQAAWEAGEMNADDVFSLLQSLDAWGGFGWEKDIDLRRQIVAVLVNNAPKRTEGAAKLSPVARLWLADYYGSIGDERCLSLADGILAEFKQPKVGSDTEALVFQALERQAWFYRDGRQYEAAAKKWASIPTVVSNTQWMIPDGIWQAGRMYLWGGKPEQAEPYFAQVEAQENKFFVTMVTYDKVGALMNAGKNEEAVQLAKQTLQISKAPLDRAINLLMLGQALYASGDFAGAQAAAQECQQQASQTKDVAPEIGFGVVEPTVQDLLKWSQLWQKTPLICWPEVVSYKVDVGKSSRKARVTVRSFKAVPLSVKCDDARVRCTVVPLKDDPWFPRRETRFAEQIIEVEVPSATALQTELHISSAQLPGATCDIPLQISF